jgi:hypothetical protein
VRHDSGIAFGGGKGDDVFNRLHDPALRIGGSFPARYASIPDGQKIVGDGLEFSFRKIACRGAIVLAKGVDDYGIKSQPLGRRDRWPSVRRC